MRTTPPPPALAVAALRRLARHRETLQRWTQIVGKVRLALTPWVNHGWHVPLYVTARGPRHIGDPRRRTARSRSTSTSSTIA
jgi:hypothetical protein